jgi:integrase
MARLRLYQRGKVWWIDGSVDGERIRESTRTTVRKEAEQIASKREQEAHQQSVFGPAAVLTFGAATGYYLDAGKSDRYIATIFAKWERRLVKDIRPGHVSDLARALYPNAGPATHNRQVITPVQAIINHSAKRGLCAPVRFERFKVNKKPTRVGSEKWLAAFMEHANPRMAALAQFMAMTGARISEAVALDWREVSLVDGTATLLKTKGGDARVASLPGPLAVTLRALPHRKGKVFGYKSRQSVQTAWNTAERLAKIEHIPPHDAGRRLFATMMIRSGIDAVTVAKAGGWKSQRMVVEVYAQPDDPKRAVERTFGKFESQAPVETQDKALIGKQKGIKYGGP